MSISPQEYAGLSDNAYENRKEGVRIPKDQEPITVDGVTYQVLEHVNNKLNGYQGTVYQRTDTGEIVVAHRGTEFDKGKIAIFQDVVSADGSMLLSRTNPQTRDAIELTRHALDFSEKSARNYGGHTPEVTVTGHSLGGALAEITAHHFNLKGETFNSYGTTSLGYRIPEGGNAVLNHVMAGDAVSAASPHYGQVRVYAVQREIDQLERDGYQNNRSRFDVRDPAKAAYDSLESHRLYNFLPKDNAGRPHVSVLDDPGARKLAETYDPMIDKYRGDVAHIRQGAIVMGLGNPIQNARHGVDWLRGPLAPGEPSGRETHVPTPTPMPGSRPEDVQRGFQQLMMPGTFGALHDGALPERAQSPATKADFRNDPSAFLDRMLAAASSGNHDTFRQMTQTLADTEPGRALRRESIAAVDHQDALAAQQLLVQQAMQVQQPSADTRAMSMG